MIRPDITSFNSYRDFLFALFEYHKSDKPYFSYQYCSSKIGVTQSYFKLIFAKKRHITLDKVTGISHTLQLTDFEKQYFTIMLLSESTADQELKLYFHSVLGVLNGRYHPDRHNPDAKESPIHDERIVANWLQNVIHSMAHFQDFKPTSAWVKQYLKHTGVSDEEIDLALIALIESKSIVEEDGRFRPASFITRNIQPFDIENFSIFNIGQSLSYEAAQDIPNHSPCHFDMISVAIDKSDAGEILDMLDNIRKKVVELSDNAKKKDLVMYFSINAFKMAKK